MIEDSFALRHRGAAMRQFIGGFVILAFGVVLYTIFFVALSSLKWSNDAVAGGAFLITFPFVVFAHYLLYRHEMREVDADLDVRRGVMPTHAELVQRYPDTLHRVQYLKAHGAAVERIVIGVQEEYELVWREAVHLIPIMAQKGDQAAVADLRALLIEVDDHLAQDKLALNRIREATAKVKRDYRNILLKRSGRLAPGLEALFDTLASVEKVKQQQVRDQEQVKRRLRRISM